MIRVEALTHGPLEIPSLSIPDGETVVIGPNGAGKTTLLRILSGITLPDSGTVVVDGVPPRQQDAGWVGEDPDRAIVRIYDKIEGVYLAEKKAVEENYADWNIKFIGHFSHWFHWGVMLYSRFIIENPPEVAQEALRLHNRVWNTAMQAVIANGGMINEHHGVGLKLSRYMRRQHGSASAAPAYRRWISPMGMGFWPVTQPEQASSSDYPFTTQRPIPGMMEFENIHIQLVDTPPVQLEHVEPGFPNLVRNADALVLILDLTEDPVFQAEILLEKLKEMKVIPVGKGLIPLRRKGGLP